MLSGPGHRKQLGGGKLPAEDGDLEYVDLTQGPCGPINPGERVEIKHYAAEVEALKDACCSSGAGITFDYNPFAWLLCNCCVSSSSGAFCECFEISGLTGGDAGGNGIYRHAPGTCQWDHETNAGWSVVLKIKALNEAVFELLKGPTPVTESVGAFLSDTCPCPADILWPAPIALVEVACPPPVSSSSSSSGAVVPCDIACADLDTTYNVSMHVKLEFPPGTILFECDWSGTVTQVGATCSFERTGSDFCGGPGFWAGGYVNVYRSSLDPCTWDYTVIVAEGNTCTGTNTQLLGGYSDSTCVNGEVTNFVVS